MINGNTWKIEPLYEPETPFLGIAPKAMEIRILKMYLSYCLQGIDKENVAYTYNRTLFSLKK